MSAEPPPHEEAVLERDEASTSVPEAPNSSDAPANKKKLPPGLRNYRRIELPSPEVMQSEEFMNNCATRTVLSGVMGSGLGVAFGIFMGTMESSVGGLIFFL